LPLGKIIIEKGVYFNTRFHFYCNSSCPGGTRACVPKRPHFGVQARMMKILPRTNNTNGNEGFPIRRAIRFYFFIAMGRGEVC
jgi:hypothetical protein